MSENEQNLSYPDTVNKGKTHKYNFWNNKPVLDFDELSTSSNYIETLKNRSVYSSNMPVVLPSNLEWKHVDLADNVEMENVQRFLQLHYIVDVKNLFRPNYTPSFIKWTLGDDGILLSIVTKKDKTICGLVGASFKKMTVFDKTDKLFASVDFLCALPKYRGKKIAFVLIDEIARQAVQKGCNAGCFTTSRCVPSPTSVIRYYHRPINYKKLFRYNFTRLQDGKEETIKKFEKLFKVTESPNPRYVPLEKKHIESVLKLYYRWMARFNIYYDYTEETFENYFLNHEFVKSYVILSPDEEHVLDFVSMYILPFNIENETEQINAAYLLSYTANTESTNEILTNLLRLSANLNIDVFNVTDIMTVGDALLVTNVEIEDDSDSDDSNKMYENRFIKGTGKLHFNFFNWKCPRVKSRQLNWITP
jgi:glycylpeptide N-tetradecanoyltransferase